MSKTIIVSGGSRGIGAAISKDLAKNGYNVVVLSRTSGSLDLSNPLIKHLPTDFKEMSSVEKSLSGLENLDNIWGVVNNCSGPAVESSVNVNAKDFEEAFQKHLHTSDLISKFALKKFMKNGGGRIVNIISVTAKIPLENMIVSNTLRGAMLNWSKTLSREYAKYNVTVNNILPGYTKTERLAEVIAAGSKKQNISEEDFSKRLTSQIPLGRFGRPEELAHVANFLISENASYINGASIPVDGGWSPCN